MSIEIRGLQKVVGESPVVDISALAVEPGEIVALVGPVGSGKETLLELLLGRTRPTVGTLRLAGVDPVRDKSGFSRKVGVLFAEDSLYRQQSARANLLFHCRLHNLPKTRADEVLALVGLGDHADVRADRLPSGLARRLAFGRATLHKPTDLLLIEPFARCDEASIALLGNLVRQSAEEGAAILILADTAAHLAPLCDRIYLLEQGRPVEASPLTQDDGGREIPFKVPVRLEGKIALVNPVEILYAEARDECAWLHTRSGQLPTQFTLSELEQRLARSGFFRAHRGYLVNLQHVKEVIPYTRNSFSLRLDDDARTVIPLSKAAAAELRRLLGY